MANTFDLNIRYLCQGRIKIPKEDVPEGIEKCDKEDILDWANRYWATCPEDKIISGLESIASHEDKFSGYVEVDGTIEGEYYRALMKTQDWQYWWSNTGTGIVEDDD
jgi:hypothetical protein